jgi:hypothetical protein
MPIGVVDAWASLTVQKPLEILTIFIALKPICSASEEISPEAM